MSSSGTVTLLSTSLGWASRWIILASSYASEWLRNILGRLPMSSATHSTPWRRLVMAVAFVVSFSVPVLLGLHGIRLYLGSSGHATRDEEIGGAFKVTQQGSYLRIKNMPHLVPSDRTPYLLSGWFKLTQLPAIGQKTILISHVVERGAQPVGMMLGLTRDAVGYRPIVYWRSAQGVGGWYQFDRFQIRSRTWFQLAVSFREGRLLGLHGVGDLNDLERGVELLGGYELEEETYPTVDSSLVVGAYGLNPFRGAIGPLAIFSGAGVDSDLHGIVKRLMRDPLKLPNLIDEESVVVRVLPDGVVDSTVEHAVEWIKPAKPAADSVADKRKN